MPKSFGETLNEELLSKGMDDGEPHIGLNNVKGRLKALCNGTLSLSPRENGGVIIIMKIPVR